MACVGTLTSLSAHPHLKKFEFKAISRYIRLIPHLKNIILLPQPIDESTNGSPPSFLPPSVVEFFSRIFLFPPADIQDSWDILKDVSWDSEEVALTQADYEAFKLHGWKLGITAISIFPMNNHCSTPTCQNLGIPLKKETARRIVVYTLASGVQPAWEVRLYCAKCNTNYHNNFSVCQGTRTYYSGIPLFVQVGNHQYIERKIIELWISQMYQGWFSASNSAKLYEMAFADHEYLAQDEWQFGSKLTVEHVWDGFTILSLLRSKEHDGEILEVPHTGEQKDRFKEAMEARNRKFIFEGQPDAVHHLCDGCFTEYTDDNGISRTAQAIVGDGLSIGRPCCGVFRCTQPLQNNRHRFCREHFVEHDICAIVGCSNPVSEGTKSCSNPLHQSMEQKNKEKGKAAFILKERYQKYQLLHPDEGESSTDHGPAVTVDEHLEWFEVEDGGNVRIFNEPDPGTIGGGTLDEGDETCPSKLALGNAKAVKARFGRRRTHNKQTLVRPCGVIFARATMFGAEAVSNFLVMIKNAFSVPGARKPEHIFYDTNCDARQQAENDPWFADIGMCVDVWHFLNKHKITHEYCQKNCNPYMYKELRDESGQWTFNTSVAEQTNAWLQGFHSMCREMLPARFDFFLDEMIRLKNIEVIQRLEKSGKNPREYDF
ncbi:hypothetical protein BJ912DRAFT_1025727 [Pholiota molesta]|nr:hypothetical protein BJ912DRAFT_1025727 [Pholiota molesta]